MVTEDQLCEVSSTTLTCGSLARILNGKRRSDDKSFGKSPFIDCSKHCAGEPRINWQRRHPLAERSQMTAAINGPKFSQCFKTFCN